MTEENYGSLWELDHCYPLGKLTFLTKRNSTSLHFGSIYVQGIASKIFQDGLKLVTIHAHSRKLNQKFFRIEITKRDSIMIFFDKIFQTSKKRIIERIK